MKTALYGYHVVIWWSYYGFTRLGAFCIIHVSHSFNLNKQSHDNKVINSQISCPRLLRHELTSFQALRSRINEHALPVIKKNALSKSENFQEKFAKVYRDRRQEKSLFHLLAH